MKIPGERTVSSQGELFCELGRGEVSEVFLDPELPGKLKADDVINVIRSKWPEVAVSVITDEPEGEKHGRVSFRKSSSWRALLPGVAAGAAAACLWGVLRGVAPGDAVLLTICAAAGGAFLSAAGRGE